MVDISNTNNMLKANEVAQLLNVHINTVRRWSNQNILKAYRVGPRGDRRGGDRRNDRRGGDRRNDRRGGDRRDFRPRRDNDQQRSED